MHEAAMLGSPALKLVRHIFESLKVEDFLEVMKLRNASRRTPLHESALKSSELCTELLKSLLSVYSRHTEGNYTAFYTCIEVV